MSKFQNRTNLSNKLSNIVVEIHYPNIAILAVKQTCPKKIQKNNNWKEKKARLEIKVGFVFI